MAACGVKMAKMSGRGLGHTGGTIDKLESFPGLTCEMSTEKFFENVNSVGFAIASQTKNIDPADKKLYALRDVTGTVAVRGLIVSSIMSKKLAAGAKNIVLDVKYGSGAFMKTAADAEVLAAKMTALGRRFGRNVAAVISNMDRPLGEAVGNALELDEAVRVLRGEQGGDIRELCLRLAAEMIGLAKGISPEEAHARAVDALESGRAYRQMQTWIASQGGDVSVLASPLARFADEHTSTVESPVSGYICHMDTEKIGLVSTALGAGRRKKDDVLDLGAGLTILKKTGDRVEKGEPLCVLYTKTPSAPDAARDYLAALRFSPEAPAAEPLIYKVIR
jgi:pyrimidine-nucleoside phosphorylase